MRKGKIYFSIGMISTLLFMSGADLNHPMVTLIGITVSILIAVKGYGLIHSETIEAIRQDRANEAVQRERMKARKDTWHCYTQTF